jgi:hypothetical protein
VKILFGEFFGTRKAQKSPSTGHFAPILTPNKLFSAHWGASSGLRDYVAIENPM